MSLIGGSQQRPLLYLLCVRVEDGGGSVEFDGHLVNPRTKQRSFRTRNLSANHSLALPNEKHLND